MKRHLCQLGIVFAVSLSFFSLSAQSDLHLSYLSTYRTNVFDESAAGTVAYDAGTTRLYFTNAATNVVAILDISDPAIPTKFGEINITPYGGTVASLAVKNGLVAVTVEGTPKTQAGKVVFFNTDGIFQREVTVGALPNAVVFTSDGKKALTANEGEPNDDYSIDPEGSVSILDISNGLGSVTVMTIGFTDYNNKKASLQNKGIRIYGPDASVAQDLEPEDITLNADNSLAYVSLQENNALAIINVVIGRVLDIVPLGYKDHQKGAPVLTQLKINELVDLPELGTPVYGGGQAPVKLGGFSGLYFDAKESDDKNYVLYTVPDRGPNDEPVLVNNVTQETFQDLRPFKLPDYQGRIVKMTVNLEEGSVKLDTQILLTRQDGTTPITGRGNVIGYDEVPVTYTDTATIYNNPDFTLVSGDAKYHELPYDPFGGDFEGIVRDTAGNFWLCDEYRPALYKFGANGTLIERFVPEGTSELGIVALEPGFYGAETLPGVYGKRWSNRGFEAIAYDADSNVIYGFIQSPLFNPDNTTQNLSDVIRILGVDAATGTPVSEYVYLLERNRDPGLAVSRVDKIGDATYTGNGKFLILERDSSVPGQGMGKKYIFEIDLKGASNILGTPISLRDTISDFDKTLEQMSADELLSEGIVAVHKTKVLNLPSIGYQAGDKAEGLTVLPAGALAVINDNDFGIAGAGISDDIVLGVIHFAENYGLDASDRDDGINIVPQPVLGAYMPDGIATYQLNGTTYLVSANEGDARDYDVLSEASRVNSLTLDTTAFPNAAELKMNEILGRLNVSNIQGDLDGDGDFDQLYSFGGRSFSIWDALGNLVFDSGDDFEQLFAERYLPYFNFSNDDNAFDSRSDNRGAEPTAVVVAEIDGTPYAFIGLERMGGAMIYNVSNPKAPVFVDYINHRDFAADVETPEAGDLGLESLVFISKENSPGGKALLVLSNEVSGTVSLFTIDEITGVEDLGAKQTPWRIFPNPVREEIFTNIVSDYSVYNTVGQQLFSAKNTNRLDTSRLSAGTYLIRDVKRGSAQLFVKQ